MEFLVDGLVLIKGKGHISDLKMNTLKSVFWKPREKHIRPSLVLLQPDRRGR